MCARLFVEFRIIFYNNTIHIIIIAYSLSRPFHYYLACACFHTKLCKIPSEFCDERHFYYNSIPIRYASNVRVSLWRCVFVCECVCACRCCAMNIWMSFCCVTKTIFSSSFFFTFSMRSRKIDLSKCHDLSMLRWVGFTYHYTISTKEISFRR